MMTSSRPRDVGGSFASRRGHSNQLSISDPSHHVTEAIGTMYGDSDDDSGPESRLDNPSFPDPSRKNRPMSFLASPAGGEQIKSDEKNGQTLSRSASDKTPLAASTTVEDTDSNGGPAGPKDVPVRMTSKRGKSYEGPSSPNTGMPPISPSLSLRDVQEAESSQFPLGSIENPSDIAQELSNLQALRRMSMDVGNTSDPDLLPFSGISLMAMPTVAPSGEDDEADLSRLLWVPAKVHPELAPDQFKNFLENRVNTIKRRSGDSTLSVEGLERHNSGSLRRKKSMLSRQVHSSGTPTEEFDMPNRLERELSNGGRSTPELSINELVKDPSKVVQKLAQETQDAASEGDLPILPVAPGMGLRRSTRTTYRKGGSLRSGDRIPFSKRVAARDSEKDGDKEPDETPPLPTIETPKDQGLPKIQTEPSQATENFSRPMRAVRRQQTFQRDNAAASPISPTSTLDPTSPIPSNMDDTLNIKSSTSRPGSSDRPQTSDSGRPAPPPAPAPVSAPIPQIVETPPPTEKETEQLSQPQSSRSYPHRSPSQEQSQQQQPQNNQQQEHPPPRSLRRPPSAKQIQSPTSPKASMEQTLSDMAQHPSPLPGGSNTRTDALTFIPTMPAEEKRKSKDESSGDSSKSTGWKWFRGEDREKKKREKEEQSKKSRSRTSTEKAAGHGDARLDVLQNSIDTALQKGRDNLLLDNESVDNKLHEERKKESSRTKSGESKKEKDGFFGSIFGGKSKKSDKDSSSSRKQRALSPEPPPRPMRPDIDYPYTRFPIVEERAIYRMAHIKLANPRRPLLSQVLLSNFMYSYLAKVQAMHPQINVPVSPQQKRAEEERRRKEQEQQQQYMMQQQMAHESEQDDGQGGYDQYGYDPQRSDNQYGDYQGQHNGSVDYIDDSQIYEHDQQRNGQERHQNGGYRNEQQNGHVDRPGSSGRAYYDYEQHEDGRRRDDEMW
ncbi:hypothetical protein MCOR27_000726 [Pyricularia oryzae]|uniref:Protein Zds1 C-terminal domain-containing protein n=3 Tax=Pyricularia TaxID=48558 RepID=A0ABQ8P0C2_PYRGI|nr:hypothetical protein MCOR01_003387 [Pyricularia oryzae]KAI6304403.1 hypothetical protein MCOR33_000497 [Pyricularia grisea]KAI6260660.1 hypothetical protein MCOR19_003006 [Pyricularia oryzae]KAI6277833.1 hypothetical protein MCOR26_004909 [Pyricularia oryzae]KAI6288912.1 hypothetical protein MCOR27_000726 [Pyricularia oryzae]